MKIEVKSLLPLISLTASLLLSACGSAPVQAPQTGISPAPDTPKETAPKRVADKSFSADTLYALLVAELAMGRQRHDIALNNYVQQAEATRDAGVAEHATHLATMLRAPKEALSMSEIWTEIEPENTEARSLYANNLVRAKRFDEAFDQAQLLIEAGETAAFENLAANAAEGGPEQTATLARKYENLLQSHPDNVSLLVGYSLLQEQLREPEKSLTTIRRAINIEPDSVSALYQESRLLQVLGRNEEAMAKMGELIAKNPENHRLRSRYARALVDADIHQAHEQYLILHKQLPFDPDVLFTLALIERELQLFEDAISRFSTLIERQQHALSSHYQLGKIYEDQLRPDKALPHYLEVNSGSNQVAALSHAVRIMLAQERKDDALVLVRSRRKALEVGQQDRAYMLEADILNKSGQVSAAEHVLSEGLVALPDSANLLYARALLYSNIDSIAAAEKDFKAILAIKPNDAATLNALGYTLADKTNRLDEAQEFISRALTITPKDPAVLDSMGWLYYRKGNYEAALVKLREAMAAMPDHEIAAHLGEVLWVTGVQEEARQVWRSGLELNPDSKIIQQTLDRLNATLH